MSAVGYRRLPFLAVLCALAACQQGVKAAPGPPYGVYVYEEEAGTKTVELRGGGRFLFELVSDVGHTRHHAEGSWLIMRDGMIALRPDHTTPASVMFYIPDLFRRGKGTLTYDTKVSGTGASGIDSVELYVKR